MEIDIDNMSLDDLRALKTRVDRAIASFDARRRKEALAAAERAARELGFNLSDLTGAGRGRRGASGAERAPKYINPQDATQTWSGRGRRPGWVVEHLEAGRNLEDLLA